LSDHDRGITLLNNYLLSAVYARLGYFKFFFKLNILKTGWISLCSRERESKEEIRFQKLKEAEALLLRARELQSADSKANCYLGLCYSEQTRVANKLLLENSCGDKQSSSSSNQQRQSAQNLPRYNAVYYFILIFAIHILTFVFRIRPHKMLL
jgi:hypothetical protein